MCDYSLGGLPNRLAVDGEELIVHRFSTHSIGLASPVDLQSKIREVRQWDPSLWHQIKSLFAPAFDCRPVRAVCVPPGARLVLKSIPMDLRCKWSVGADESVFFMQTSAEVNTYRDALHFRTGRQVLLQDLREGISRCLAHPPSQHTCQSSKQAWKNRSMTWWHIRVRLVLPWLSTTLLKTLYFPAAHCSKAVRRRTPPT
jgi:hypothetical protein